ncbi:DUF4350 domain-containing protein [Pseudomonas sp. 5P_3.1_Bac2]|uniref:DUF4350 domain-containing protein n=1 Tax=Pseudomonas sp. 5P_3.1_Bac2 TaxID=2971617 RepID=UPI0021C6B025|nr:DUF4350 domain-containing protein [Pseudomonas sp. 5P_3.1_Bac2]MCU1715707.1 DUF4350 domain-containing protein [Pseudomonas sp. 5P_3.1_Bac2]
MKRSYKLMLLGLLLIILGGLGVELFNQLEPYTDSIKRGPSPEAKANPYLAAEHFLRQQGISVQQANDLHGLHDLPSAGHTLLLLGDRRRMTPKQSQRVLDWASKGGHLVFVAEAIWDEAKGKSGDLLLDSLGVQQFSMSEMAKTLPDDDMPPEDAEDTPTEPNAQAAEDAAQAEQTDAAPTPEQASAAADADASDETATAAEEDRYPLLTKLYLENEQAPAYIDFDPDFHLFDAQDRAHIWANSGEATHLLEIYHGEGLITVLSDSWIWTNKRLDRYDNAWLLWYLSQDSAVTLVHNPDHDDLFSLLLRYFPHALLALLLLVLATLWHLAPRQGPLQPAVSRHRRQLQEHLRASADFILRHNGQQRLLQGLQQDIQRRARQRQPGFERLPVAEQWQSLSRLSRQAPSFISQCMRTTATPRLSAADFTRQVANLQTLRNAL